MQLEYYKILSNKAQCLICKDIIESKYRHDFVRCTCKNISVDGGRDYIKRGFRSDKWIELSFDTSMIKVIF